MEAERLVIGPGPGGERRVEEHEDVMPDVIKPGTVRNFKIKYRLPKGTDSLALSIMSADAVNDSTTADLKK